MSRALRDNLGLHVLALDWSDVQSKGAARRDVHSGSSGSTHSTLKGSLTYLTIPITPVTLLTATDNWLEKIGSDPTTTPVLFVALHACGSLTLDIVRALASRLRSSDPSPKAWTPSMAIIVGCCYNLLQPQGMFHGHPVLKV